MKKVEINIYKFEELADKIREKLIESEIETQSQFYCDHVLEEDLRENAYDMLKLYFGFEAEDLEKVQPYYSLSNCQGDGAMIEFKVETEAMIKHLLESKIITKSESKKINMLDISVKQSGHYYHERSIDICYDIETDKDKNYATHDKIEYYIENGFETTVVACNIALGKNGYKIIEDSYITESDAIDYLSEYKYYEDGEAYYDGK